MFSGVCCCKPHKHCVPMTGIIVTGCATVTNANQSNAVVTDVGIGMCGHATMIATGSPTVTCNNLANARVGDAVAGCINGVLITGAPETTNNN